MKVFDRFIIAVSVMMMTMIFALNLILFSKDSDNSKLYKVEINRIEHELNSNNEINSDDYNTILGIYKYDSDEDFYNYENEYVILEINGILYRIEYDDKIGADNLNFRLAVNILMGIIFLITLLTLLYIRNKIIKPFMELSNYPYQLAKGTLSVPLKENKKRYFGKFIWGLDILRETLEKSELRELERAKKEKSFLMSVSHDIKTSLSAIKLYSKAVSQGMYTRNKRLEVMEIINLKADEIEKFVNEIIKNLSSEFMTFEINPVEFYLSHVIDKVKEYYSEKLFALGTDFNIKEYTDCLISGDPDRLEEVFQNIIENAIKYGDGHYITISFSDEEDFRLITVSNGGCTLPDTELPHIFDSFWRGSNTENKQGCGLGLYICRRLMNTMGGDIFAEISNDNMNVTVVCRKSY